MRLTYSGVAASWSEVYRCILTFTPTKTILRQTYTTPSLPSLNLDHLCITSGAWEHWPRDTLAVDTRHQKVDSIAVSPDSQVVAYGAYNMLGLCSTHTGALLHTMTTHHPDSVWCVVAISPDGQRILSCTSHRDRDSPGLVEEWDIATGTCLSSSRHLHSTYVGNIKYSPDGRYAAICSWDLNVSIWDTASLAESATVMTGHEGFIHRIAFTRDGECLLSAASDGTTRVWDVHSKTCLHVLKHETALYTVAITHDNALTACGGIGIITIWDTRTWSTVRHIRTQPTSWMGLDFSPDDTKLAAGSVHGSIEIYDPATGHLLSSLVGGGFRSGIWGLQFSPNGQYLVSSGGDALVRMTNMQSEPTPGKGDPLYQDGISRTDWIVRLLTRLSCTSEHTTAAKPRPIPRTVLVRSLGFSSDGTLLACGGVGIGLVALDPLSGKEHMRIMNPGPDSPEITFLRWSSTGHLLMAGIRVGKDCKICVWKVDATHHSHVPNPIFVAYRRSNEVWTGCFTHDDQSVVCGDVNDIHLYALESDQRTGPSRTIYRGNGRVTAIAISSDSTLVLAGSLDRSSPSSVPDAHPPPSRTPVYAVDDYNDDRSAASVYPTLRLLDFQSGQVLWLENWGSTIFSVAFSFDSTRALVGLFVDILLLDITPYLRRRPSHSDDMTNAPSPSPLLQEVDSGEHNLVEALCFSTDGHAIVSGTSFTSLSTENMPLNHSLEPSTTPVYIVEHGWVWCIVKNRRRRIGWVPSEYRDGRDSFYLRVKGGMAIRGKELAFSRKDGGLTLLHVVDRST